MIAKMVITLVMTSCFSLDRFPFSGRCEAHVIFRRCGAAGSDRDRYQRTFVYFFRPLSFPVLTSWLFQTDAHAALFSGSGTNDSNRRSIAGASSAPKSVIRITALRSEFRDGRDRQVFAGIRVLRGTLK